MDYIILGSFSYISLNGHVRNNEKNDEKPITAGIFSNSVQERSTQV